MNKNLLNKLLNKVTLEELYSVFKDNESSYLIIAKLLYNKYPLSFNKMIKDYINNLIEIEKHDKNDSYVQLFKELLINYDDSYNELVRDKILESNKNNRPEPC